MYLLLILKLINVPEYLQDLITKYDLSPEMLLVEITETAFSENNIIVRETIDQLHQHGFCVLWMISEVATLLLTC